MFTTPCHKSLKRVLNCVTLLVNVEPGVDGDGAAAVGVVVADPGREDVVAAGHDGDGLRDGGGVAVLVEQTACVAEGVVAAARARVSHVLRAEGRQEMGDGPPFCGAGPKPGFWSAGVAVAVGSSPTVYVAVAQSLAYWQTRSAVCRRL